MSRYFLDTEFLDDGKTIDLISIALVCDDDRELYLVNNEFDESRADDWLRANVMPQLPARNALTKHRQGGGPIWRSREAIRDAMTVFIIDDGNPVEIWAYFASYDWVAFAQLFGKMINLPKHFPKFVRDLKTFALDLGYTAKFKDLIPDHGHHDALEDARWNQHVHTKLCEMRDAPVKALSNYHKQAEAAAKIDLLALGCPVCRSTGVRHEATRSVCMGCGAEIL
jgi:hypothetical protein